MGSTRCASCNILGVPGTETRSTCLMPLHEGLLHVQANSHGSQCPFFGTRSMVLFTRARLMPLHEGCCKSKTSAVVRCASLFRGTRDAHFLRAHVCA